jgi:hypothetical protein
MKVVLHFPNLSQPPVGIWWLDPETSQLQAAYIEGVPELEIRGRETMSQKLPDYSWNEFWQWLTDQVPYFSAWAVVDMDEENVTPEEFLDLTRNVRST